MNQVDSIDVNDPNMIEKLNMIAQRVAQEQQKIKAKLGGMIDDTNLIDPSDAFACEGCQ